MNYSTILQTYTLAEILEVNDITEEDVLEVLVEAGIVTLPEILPLGSLDD